jgi:hypothetical protein
MLCEDGDGFLSLCCPDWTLSGWDAEFGDLYDSQLFTLNDVTGREHSRDKAYKKVSHTMPLLNYLFTTIQSVPELRIGSTVALSQFA